MRMGADASRAGTREVVRWHSQEASWDWRSLQGDVGGTGLYQLVKKYFYIHLPGIDTGARLLNTSPGCE